MSLSKKFTYIIVVIALLGSIICLIASSVSNHIKTMYDLYRCFDETLKYVSKSTKLSVGSVKLNKSFNFELKTMQNSEPYFSSFVLSNNTSKKRMDISVKSLKINGNSVNMSTFISNDNVGFYFGDNPQNSYSIDSDNFRTKWNESIYSNIYKMPDFIPNNLNYDKASSILTGDNLLKSLVALSFGGINAKPAELINNVRVSKYVNGKDLCNYHISVSKDYVTNVLDKLKKSSGKACISFLNPYITHIDDFLTSSIDKTFDISFISHGKIITRAESSVRTEEGVYNITANIGKDITVTVKNLSSQSSANLYLLKYMTNKNRLSFILSAGDVLIATADIKMTEGNLYMLNLAYTSQNKAAKLYTAKLSDKPAEFYQISDTKNIYSMPLTELINLYKLFTDG